MTSITEMISKLREYGEALRTTIPGYGLPLIKLADDLEEELRREGAA